MMKKVFLFVLIWVLWFDFAHSQKVGLVLSGGGAKGIVHVGIIKALEENEIPIDYIAGTSIGAIVGGLYAIGYSSEEILQLFLSDDFYYWQTGKVEDDFQFYFRKGADDPSFVHFNIPLGDSIDIRESILPNSLVNPLQMNQVFFQIFSQANAQCGGDFNKLFVPFLCIASDVFNKKPVIFRYGDLGDAIRSSMTFPLFFKPLIKDGIPLWDGGIYDNFPVKPMKQAWRPDLIIGSAVAGYNSKKPSEQSLYSQMENMVMQQTTYEVSPEDGFLMKFDLEDINLMDFNKAEELFDIGYKHTLEIMDSIKSRVQRRISSSEIEERRGQYKKTLPKFIFRNIYISGVTDAQKVYIENQIHRDNEDNFTIRDFKRTYFRLLTNSKIKEILPHAEYDPENQTFDLYLDITMNNELGVSFGGNISSINANQMYLGIGYQSLTKLSTNLHLDMQIGNAYSGVTLQGRLEIPYKIPMDVFALYSLNTKKYYESEKLFIDTELLTFINQRESFGKLGVGFPFLTRAKMDAMIGYGDLEDRYYQNNNGQDAGFDRSRYNLFTFGLFYRKNSLDTKQYPISGHNHQIHAQYISGKETFFPSDNVRQVSNEMQSYIQLSASFNNYHVVNSKINLGYRIDGVLSSKNLWTNYTASILQAPGFTPTPHSMLVFNEAFHANQYLAGGLTPIYKLNSTIHFRGDFYGFFPLYPIKKGEGNKAYYGELLRQQHYMGEVSLIAQLPFMSVSLYANYYTYPAKNWNFGLNIGYLIFGPKFIP